MSIRIGTFNVNNLFERTAVMDLGSTGAHPSGFSPQAAKVLEDVAKLNSLLVCESYSGTTGKKILSILKRYFEGKKNPYFVINEVRGRLFRTTKRKQLELVAAGREDWIGWVEFIREPVDEESTRNIGRVIQALNTDVLCLVEVEDRPTLCHFNEQILKNFSCRFNHAMLIDGNDPRGIDVALLSNYKIRSVRSHVDYPHEDNTKVVHPIFSRDCPEYEIVVPSGRTLWILVNHFKSKGYGSPKESNARRTLQARAVKDLLTRFVLTQEYVVVAGDFNDTPDSVSLTDLLRVPNLIDVLGTPLLNNGPRWTFSDGRNQFDYLLVSKALCAAMTKVGIERRGMFSKNNFSGPFPHFPEVTSEVNQASDHAAVWAEFEI